MKNKINLSLMKILISIILILCACFFKINNNLFLMLLIISYILSGMEVYLNAIKNIREGQIIDENLLMIIATIGAFYIGKYLEAVMVMLLFQIGEYLSSRAINKSKENITNLMDLRSDIVFLKKGNDVIKINAVDAKIGDIFVVKPGEKIPLDGEIIKGESNIDTSMLTGEYIPKHLKKGNEVISGTINLDSIIEVKVTATLENSTASKIIEIIENSNESKAKTEKFITKFAKVYTPFVIILAILIVLIPSFLGLDFNTWLYRALEFLVISCPCALVISIPLAYFCGIGKCSHEGILIKASETLENLTTLDNLVFDKTGTLTKGIFKITKVSNKDVLKLAAYAEINSNHPISKAILSEYKGSIDETKIKNFKEISGKGITCQIDEDTIIVGTKKFLKKNKIDIKENINDWGTIVYVGKNNKYIGYIIVSDIIKENSIDVIKELKNLGVKRIVMLSGDDKTVVENVSLQLGIDEYYGNLLPQEKIEKLNQIKSTGLTAFVGDGINDAPVIKLADLGIAMGGIGSDAAIEASDMVLMHDDLEKIVTSIKIAKITKKIIIFNIVLALLIKVFMLLFAAFGIATIWMAVFADVGVTFISVLNSLRIMAYH